MDTVVLEDCEKIVNPKGIASTIKLLTIAGTCNDGGGSLEPAPNFERTFRRERTDPLRMADQNTAYLKIG